MASAGETYYGTSTTELLRAFTMLSVEEVLMAAAASLWLVILCLPLSGVDRRDHIAGLTYVLFCISAGVMLTIALPGRFGNFSDAPHHLEAIALFAFVAAVRWMWRRRPLPRIGRESPKPSVRGEST